MTREEADVGAVTPAPSADLGVAQMATPASSAGTGEESTLQVPPTDQTSVPPFRLGNRPALTGIRALAMATVLVYHANFATMPGSWVALQIFFVLSGFLITAMMASEAQRHGRISLTRFYSRRAVRLLPPLFLAVALVAIYASFVHVYETSQRVWGDSFAALFYYADYRSALGHAPFLGFFARHGRFRSKSSSTSSGPSCSPSLSHEGDALWPTESRSTGMLLSAIDRTWISVAAPHFTAAVATRTYYAFDTRADALFFGCILGLMAADGYFQRLPQWVPRMLTAAAAAAAVLFVWVLFKVPVWNFSTMVWWQPITTVASAVLIMYFVLCPHSTGTRFVGLGVFVFLGELSYTVYLVHFGVYLALLLVRTEPTGPSGPPSSSALLSSWVLPRPVGSSSNGRSPGGARAQPPAEGPSGAGDAAARKIWLFRSRARGTCSQSCGVGVPPPARIADFSQQFDNVRASQPL